MQRRTFLTGALGLLATVTSTSVLAAPRLVIGDPALSLPAAINKAGRQRMLSQRCSKAWLMQLAGVLPDEATRILQDSMQLFDVQLAELAALQPSATVSNALQAQAAAWDRLRVLLQQKPTRALAEALYAGNEELLQAAHQTTQAYEQAAGSPIGQLINVAGRQRMLSQRMAKFYYFRKLGISAQASGQELDKAVDEFGEALRLLSTATQNSPTVRADLGLVEQQWFFFQQAVSNAVGFSDAKGAANVATTSERILEQLDLVVAGYEQIARS